MTRMAAEPVSTTAIVLAVGHVVIGLAMAGVVLGLVATGTRPDPGLARLYTAWGLVLVVPVVAFLVTAVAVLLANRPGGPDRTLASAVLAVAEIVLAAFLAWGVWSGATGRISAEGWLSPAALAAPAVVTLAVGAGTLVSLAAGRH